jgi:hypothetical protein
MENDEDYEENANTNMINGSGSIQVKKNLLSQSFQKNIRNVGSNLSQTLTKFQSNISPFNMGSHNMYDANSHYHKGEIFDDTSSFASSHHHVISMKYSNGEMPLNIQN